MTLLFIALFVGGVLVELYAWGLPPFSSAVQTTDNAYVRGKTPVIAPQVNGYIVEVPVQDYAQVRKGQVLARTIGSAHVRTQVTNAHLLCRLLLEKPQLHTTIPPSIHTF